MLGAPRNGYVTCICVCILSSATISGRIKSGLKWSRIPACPELGSGFCGLSHCMMPSGFSLLFPVQEQHWKRTVWMQYIHMAVTLSRWCANRHQTVPPCFFLHFTLSSSLFCDLLLLGSYWESCRFVAATRVWAVIRGWVIRTGSGLFGNACIWWHAATFCSHDWQLIVPGSLKHPGAMVCSGDATEAVCVCGGGGTRALSGALAGLRDVWPPVVHFPCCPPFFPPPRDSEWEKENGVGGWGRWKENLKLILHPVQPDLGLVLTALRPWPEPKSGVGHLTNEPPGAPPGMQFPSVWVTWVFSLCFLFCRMDPDLFITQIL